MPETASLPDPLRDALVRAGFSLDAIPAEVCDVVMAAFLLGVDSGVRELSARLLEDLRGVSS